jgi:tetratricopeptide (TPR) repeat protein
VHGLAFVSRTLAIALVLLALSSQRASAADDADSAAELRARTHFAAGEYKQALDIFARLYAETLHPTYLRNVGRCHQRLGDADNAIATFRDYLRKAKDLTAEQRAEVEGFIAEMEQLKRSRRPTANDLTVPPATETPAALVASPAIVSPPPDEPQRDAFYGHPWFWVTVAVLAAGSATAVLLLTADGSPSHGNIGLIDLRSSLR